MTNYRRKRKPEKPVGKQHIINDAIDFESVRIIDDEGVMRGVFTRAEAIKLAEDEDKDLVLINPKGIPPIVKIIDFNKYKYQSEKTESGIKSKAAEIKILMVSVRISLNDLQVRAKKADDFLDKGMKVKLQVKMRGREKAFPDVAKETIELFLKSVTHDYQFESIMQLEGDSYTAIIKSKK
jgi:translation initiation factor IF-3